MALSFSEISEMVFELTLEAILNDVNEGLRDDIEVIDGSLRQTVSIGRAMFRC